MCGIVGIVGQASYDYISNNLHLLHRRGPDNCGILQITEKLTMGATRLAMVDPLSRSNQPMLDNNNGNVIVFNGEIYNFMDIRKALSSLNIKFETNSDTEVLLKAMDEYGPKYICNLEGMFAFAFYNKKENKLILARDYLGKKPLFYSISKDYLVFSSQIDIVKKFIKTYSIDNLSLSTYLKLGYLVNPRTMYNEIKMVMPGQFIEFDITTNKFLSMNNYIPTQILKPSTYGIKQNLEGSFKERIDSQGRFALSMSGGIDSTIIAILALDLKSDFDAYTMNWPDSDKDRYNEDARNAALICKRLGINHFIVDMPKSTELPSLLKEYTYAMGEPNSNPSGISMMSLYSQISTNGFRLVITGDGADEILGGYERYQVINKLNRFPSLRFPKSEEIFHSLESKNNTFAKMMLGLVDSDSLMFWLHWQDLAKHKYLKKFYKDYQSDYFEIFQDDFQKIFNTKNKVASTMFKDLKIWLSMESNNKLDRISMFHSIEARSPFQSEKVIGSSIAEMAKGNFNKLEKKLLINNFPLLRSLPVNKVKLGFISPLGQWLRSSPELVNESMKQLQVNFDFDNKELNRLIKTPTEGNYRDFRYLWNLIVLASWLEIK